MPPSPTDWLPEGHLVYFILDVVERLEPAKYRAGDRKEGCSRRKTLLAAADVDADGLRLMHWSLFVPQARARDA